MVLKMITHVRRVSHVCKSKRGRGFINNLINKLPLELHIPGYNYCGPGTKLQKRLARNDHGVNPLDESCKLHDIAYSRDQSLDSRHQADLRLAAAAENRWRDPSTPFGERLAALTVDKIMKYKVKRGMGVTLSKVIKASRNALKKHMKGRGRGRGKTTTTTAAMVNVGVKAAKRYMQGKIVKSQPPPPRVIPVPKKGGFLPLIPLLSALAATGTLAGGVTTAAKNIYEMVKNKNTAAGNGKVVGKGLYLAPYKRGMGLYITHAKKKN